MPKLIDALRLARAVKPQHARTFARTVVPQVVRPARVIWNQAIGAVFLILAVPALMKALQFFREPQHDQRSVFVLVLSVIFSGVMAGFGIASLLRARRIGSGR